MEVALAVGPYDSGELEEQKPSNDVLFSIIKIGIGEGEAFFCYRHYSPETGTFISPEPTGIDGPNLYWYTQNNPMNYIDPTGLDRVEVLLEGGTHVGLLIFDPEIPGNNIFIDFGPRKLSLDVLLNKPVSAVVDIDFSVSRDVGVRIPGTHIRQSRENDDRDIQRALRFQEAAKRGNLLYQLLDFNNDDSSFNCRGFVDRTL